jgi:broad specificity phosphatase PhoE
MIDILGRMLILVRHATPAHGPLVPPEQWELDAALGRPAAVALARVLPAGACLVSSYEPKARQTLEPSGPVTTDERFNEVVRKEPYEGDFRARRHAYVSGVDHDDWEPRADVVARFDAGIEEWQRVAGARPVVVASHGMAMTLWLTAAIGLRDPGAFWSELRMPDPMEIDLRARTVRRIDPEPY